MRTLFDAHPNVCIPLECQIIPDLHPTFGNKTFWKKKDILSFYNEVINSTLFGHWNIDLNYLRNTLLEFEGENSFQTLCKVVYYCYHSFFPKSEIKFIADKTPNNTEHIYLLSKLFPEAKFIYITRDYRDNILSIKNADFGSNNIFQLSFLWRERWKLVTKFSNENPSKVYKIRYEDFVKSPQEHLKAMCDFINLTYVESVFNFNSSKEKFYAYYGRENLKRFHGNLFNPINSELIYGWKTKMKTFHVKIADYIIGDIAEKSNYERKYYQFSLFFKLFVKLNLLLIIIKLTTLNKLKPLLPIKKRLF